MQIELMIQYADLLPSFYLRRAVVGVPENGKHYESSMAGCSTGKDKSGLVNNEIAIIGRRIVVSKHASGVICAYDSRHRILKVPVEGGVIAELVQERTGSDTIYGTYRNQLLAIRHGSDAAVVEF
jgi:hypothetical protein